MSYKASTYQKALNILQEIRNKAENEANIKQIFIQEKIPELRDIQKKLTAIGLSISKLYFNDENVEREFEKLRNESLKLQQRKKEILLKNGVNEDELMVHYNCSFCKDTGYVDGRMCMCHRQLLIQLERDEIEKMAPLDKCTFENFKLSYYPDESSTRGITPRYRAEQILEYCRQYAQTLGSHSKNLLLIGGTGLGKTHLSLAIANVAINKGLSVVFGTCQNIVSDLNNESFGRETKNYNTNTVFYTDLLIIEHLVTELQKEYT